jgi:hypothetical protein
MTSILNRLSSYILGATTPRLSPSQLIDRESKLGSTIFGALPKGVSNRHFFYDRNGHWYFSQVITDDRPREETIHYQIFTHGIQKTTSVRHLSDPRQQVPLQHEWIVGEEVTNLLAAAKIYKQRISELYTNSSAKRTA